MRHRASVVRRAGLPGMMIAACMLGGCVTETREPDGPVNVYEGRPLGERRQASRRPPRGESKSAPGDSSRTARGPSQGPDDITDPCASRLHDLSGQLLMFYAVNKRLPDMVDELTPFAESAFAADCPKSNQPYVYAPGGLRSSSSGDRYLILYDATPAHGGLRWGVFVAPPQAKQPPATWVILMSEEVFRGYVPATR